MSFFKRVIYAIKDFDKYQDFALENKAIAMRYIMKIVLILALTISICFMCKFVSIVKNSIHYFREEFPDLHFSNNELTVETDTPIIHEVNDIFDGVIIIDTSSVNEEVDYKEKIDTYENCVIFAKDSCTIKNLQTTKNYSYSSIVDIYGINEFNKQTLEGYLTNKNVYTFYLSVFIVMYLYTYIIYFITTILDAVLLTIFGILISRVSKINLKASAIYKMSLYALTLPIILNIIYIIINAITGFKIQYFDWMYTAISFVYLITAILIIKSDIIKQQMELLKIEEEQKKIREQQRQKEEEEKEKQEQERREKEKEKKKKEGKAKQEPEPEPEGT